MAVAPGAADSSRVSRRPEQHPKADGGPIEMAASRDTPELGSRPVVPIGSRLAPTVDASPTLCELNASDPTQRGTSAGRSKPHAAGPHR